MDKTQALGEVLRDYIAPPKSCYGAVFTGLIDHHYFWVHTDKLRNCILIRRQENERISFSRPIQHIIRTGRKDVHYDGLLSAYYDAYLRAVVLGYVDAEGYLL